jgi:DNA-directed RNA polymerase subunit RPC12/RpoP
MLGKRLFSVYPRLTLSFVPLLSNPKATNFDLCFGYAENRNKILMEIKMFKKRYIRYCYECNKEFAFRTAREIKAFDLGSDWKCPRCRARLHFFPKPPYCLAPPPPVDIKS